MNLETIGLLLLGAFLLFCGVMAGGWLVFKSKAGPGEGFIRAPKGEAFVIPGEGVVENYSEEPNKAEENVLKRSAQFMKRLGGLK